MEFKNGFKAILNGESGLEAVESGDTRVAVEYKAIEGGTVIDPSNFKFIYVKDNKFYGGDSVNQIPGDADIAFKVIHGTLEILG